MKVDLCDLRRQFRAWFFASDRDVTLQSDRYFYLGDGTQILPSALVPIGGIILWSGAIVDIPTNWAICDGNNGTPDLTDRFVVGAGDSYAVNDTGGSTTKDLSHTHGDGSYATDNDTHNHDVTGTSGSESSHTHSDGSYATGAEGGGHLYGGCGGTGTPLVTTAIFEAHTHDVQGTSGSGSSHSHSSGSYATDNDTHNHDVTGTSGSGGSATQDILPPYYALAYIMRLS